RDPDHQAERLSACPSLDRVQELPAERENLIGVAERHAAHLGQHEIPPLAREQLLAQDLLEAMNLAADGRMRQAELLASAGQTPLLRNDPEIEQVMIVQPFHALSICRFFRQITMKLPHSLRIGSTVE